MNKEVQSFINYNSGNPKKVLRGLVIILLFISIPTAVFGIWNTITKILIIPITVLLIVWDVIISFDTIRNMKSYYLILGSTCVYVSLILILSIFKLLSSIICVSPIVLAFAYLIYALILFMFLYMFSKLIRNGFYLRKHKQGKIVLIIPFCALGVILERLVGRILSPRINTMIMCCAILTLIFVFTLGSVNLLKYYYMIKYRTKNH